jgi:hypothetical protein
MNMILGGFQPQHWGYGAQVRVRSQDLTRAATWLKGYEEHKKSKKKRDH